MAGRGTNTNVYTGNTFTGRGSAGYNPSTGVVAVAGTGYAGNIYSRQGTAGRGGFAYNTNTEGGVAVGNNNDYAGNDGTVYRYNRQNSSGSQNNGSGWQTTSRSSELQQQQRARSMGRCEHKISVRWEGQEVSVEDGGDRAKNVDESLQ